MWIWQNADWQQFSWDKELLEGIESDYADAVAELDQYIARTNRNVHLRVDALVRETISSNKIEGIILDTESVRGSFLTKLGVNAEDNSIEVRSRLASEALYEAKGYQGIYTTEFLREIHALYMQPWPEKHPGQFRTPDDGEMCIRKGPRDKDVTYEAVPSDRVAAEMDNFCNLMNSCEQGSVVRAGLAHLHFVLIHPFLDGNGRLARILAERELDPDNNLVLSLSDTIGASQSQYYRVLQDICTGTQDITQWLSWFGKISVSAAEHSLETAKATIRRGLIFSLAQKANCTERECRVLDKVTRGFEGNLTLEKIRKLGGYGSLEETAEAVNHLKSVGILEEFSGNNKTIYELSLIDDVQEEDTSPRP